MDGRTRATALVVIGALVATTTCASRADYGPEALDPPRVVYLHDAAGRLHAVGDPEGDTAVYRYDAVGNLREVERRDSGELSVIDVVPARASPGDEVLVTGTGFDVRASDNTVTFGDGGASASASTSAEAEVVEAGRFELRVVVPEDAATGPLRVEASGSTATSPDDVVVEPDRRPVVTGVSPATVAAGAGDEIRIEGRNFTGDPLLDQVVIGATTYATVTSATSTEIVATVPATASSGRVSVATPHGTARSDDTLVVAPLGYTAEDVAGFTRAEVGEPVALDLADDGDGEGSVELVAFEARRGDAVALTLASDGLGCADVAIGLADPTGVELVDPHAPAVPIGTAREPWCAEDDPPAITLPATGLYTLTIASRGSGSGSVELTLRESDRPAPSSPTVAEADADDDEGGGRSEDEGGGSSPAVGEGLRAGGDGPFDGFGWVPVDLASGALVVEATDMVVADLLPLVLSRSHWPVAASAAATPGAEGAFGLGSALELDLRLRPSPALQYVQLVLPNGLPIVFDRTTGGTDRDSAVFEHRTTPTGFFGATVTWSGTGWDLRLPEGTTLEFAPDGPLRALRDPSGNATTVRRADATDRAGRTVPGNVTSVHSPTGRWLAFDYDDRDRITEARNHLGDAVSYRYDAAGRLVTVVYTAGRGDDRIRDEVGYGYDDQGRVTAVRRGTGSGQLRVSIAYDAAGRVVRQQLPDGSTYAFAYATGTSPTGIEGVELEGVTRATVTDPRGAVRRVSFDDGGRWVSDTSALGSEDEQAVTATRDPETGLVTTQVDGGGVRSGYRYDGEGNVVEASAAGDAGAAGGGDDIRARLAYDAGNPQPTEITSPDGLTSGLSYDEAGNLVRATTPAGGELRFEHDRRGRLTSVTDADGNTTTFAYELGHRVTATDPQGGTSSEFYDAAGRLASRTDPSGATTTYGYDALGRLRTVTDPLGASTAFEVGAAGDVTALVDAAGDTTSYAYDERGRGVRRTDPSGATDTYAYDPAGNVVAHTDRRGVRTRFAYDDAGRLRLAAYGVDASGRPESASSTVRYGYDQGGRLVRVEDSDYGTVTLAYDDLGRLTSETTPQGTVEHAYDAAGRRTSTVVDGGTPIAYGYDRDSGLLTSVTRGSAEVALDHDRLGRVEHVELPNGVAVDREHDDRDSLVGLDWSVRDSRLGDVGYRHDVAGRRRAVDGTLAPSVLPESLLIDDGDRAYDEAGNVTSDGTRSYEWDARSRLVAVTVDGGVEARFAYDPFGRRTGKTVDGTTTSYTYDGPDVVRTETDGSSATYLSGPGADDLYARIAGDDVTSYVTDAQGSVLGLVDADGALATTYDYDPFGRTTRHGDDDPNPFTYTGRELDETGLVYLRARYYDPGQGRFVSQDPIGFAGGDPNLFAYAGNDPVDLTDPSGLQAGNIVASAACAAGAAYWMGVVTENVDRLLEILDPDSPTLGTEQASVEIDRITRENFAALEVFLTVCGLAFSLPGLGGLVSRGTASFGRTLATRFPNATARLTTRFPALAPRFSLTTPLAAAPEALSMGAARASTAGSPWPVNPLGGTMNCLNCVIAGDATLAGSPASALYAVEAQPVAIIERTFGATFRPVAGQAQVETMLFEAGPGARGIVYGGRRWEAGHVFNAVNEGGSVRFQDFQSGTAASFDGYDFFEFLWTSLPR